MKLSEIRDDAALDVIAEIIDPLSELSVDDEFKNLINSGQRIEAVKHAIKNHKKAIIQIMASLEGEKVEDYHFNLISLPIKLMRLVNEIGENEELKMLFHSGDATKTSSTSPLENIEVGKE